MTKKTKTNEYGTYHGSTMLKISVLRLLWAGVICFWGTCFQLSAQIARETIYLTNMSLCEPAEHLSEESQPDKWRLIPFKTKEVQGVTVFTAPKSRLQMFAEKLHFAAVPFGEL